MSAILSCNSLDLILPATINSGRTIYYNILVFRDISKKGNLIFEGTMDEWLNVRASTSSEVKWLQNGNLYINGKLITELKYSEGVTDISNLGSITRGSADITKVIFSSTIMKYGTDNFKSFSDKVVPTDWIFKSTTPATFSANVTDAYVKHFVVPDGTVDAYKNTTNLTRISAEKFITHSEYIAMGGTID